MKFFLKPRVAILNGTVKFRYRRVLAKTIAAIVPVTPDENITNISLMIWDLVVKLCADVIFSSLSCDVLVELTSHE